VYKIFKQIKGICAYTYYAIGRNHILSLSRYLSLIELRVDRVIIDVII